MVDRRLVAVWTTGAGARRVRVRILRRIAQSTTGDSGIGDSGQEQLERPQRVVVARNHVIDIIRVAIGVDDADDGNLQLPSLVDRDLLLTGVHDEHRVR